MRRREFVTQLAGAVAALPIAALVLALANSKSLAQAAKNEPSTEALRLELDKEKWRDEREMRVRELALKERELSLREGEQVSSKWFNPLFVAICAAALAALGNLLVTFFNGRTQLKLETSKAESTRILEMIKTGDTEAAAKNLEFLLGAGLVVEKDQATSLREYLDRRQPGKGPSLPSPGRFAFEATTDLTADIQTELQGKLEAYIAYLDKIGSPPDLVQAKIKIGAVPGQYARYQNNTLEIDSRIARDVFVALREYSHHALTSKTNNPWTGNFAGIESGLADYFPASFLNNPRVGEISAEIIRPGQPYLRCLDNRLKFKTTKALKDDPWTTGEIWGGAFWEMRNRLTGDVIDPILMKAWWSLLDHPSKTSAPKAFAAEVLAAAKLNQHDKTIQTILRNRGFSLDKAASVPGP